MRACEHTRIPTPTRAGGNAGQNHRIIISLRRTGASLADDGRIASNFHDNVASDGSRDEDNLLCVTSDGRGHFRPLLARIIGKKYMLPTCS
jgi:hypothetical protein